MENCKNQINIVLLEPQIPQNTGNIARTCAVTGARLHLVGPMGFVVEDKKLKRAGLDYWHLLDITYYENYAEFLQKNAEHKENFFYFTTKGRSLYSAVQYPAQTYIIFGREDKGIDEKILIENAPKCVRIPMLAGARSLNLSNTVAIAAYEILRNWDFPQLENFGQLHGAKWEDII